MASDQFVLFPGVTGEIVPVCAWMHYREHYLLGVVAFTEEHLRVHNGQFFTTGYMLDIPAAGSLNVLFSVPEVPKIHMNYGYDVEAEIGFALYEGVTASNDGTQLAPRNRDRNQASNVGHMLAYHTPTITDLGLTLFQWHSGSGPTVGGGIVTPNEFIMKANSKYLFRITNLTNVANFCSIRFDWYEDELT